MCSSWPGLNKYHAAPYESPAEGQNWAEGQQKVFLNEPPSKYSPADLEKSCSECAVSHPRSMVYPRNICLCS